LAGNDAVGAPLAWRVSLAGHVPTRSMSKERPQSQ
jgi:hypothetical protein